MNSIVAYQVSEEIRLFVEPWSNLNRKYLHSLGIIHGADLGKMYRPIVAKWTIRIKQPSL
jgi:hypothetical protein